MAFRVSASVSSGACGFILVMFIPVTDELAGVLVGRASVAGTPPTICGCDLSVIPASLLGHLRPAYSGQFPAVIMPFDGLVASGGEAVQKSRVLRVKIACL